MFNTVAACIIFIAAYIFIIVDKIDRAVVALAGAALLVLLKIIGEKEVFLEIDFNTLVLLISMMVIVMTLKRSGIFEYLAIKTVKISKGKPLRIIFFLSLITGILSAALDNVTTILLILPVVFSIAADLKINPVPLVISQIFASNVGGTATLIGDPPNIMIGSATGLSFSDFIIHIAVIAIPLLVATSLIFVFIYRKDMKADAKARKITMAIDETLSIKDKPLLIKGLGVLSLTIIGFMLHGVLGYESSTVSLAGAVTMLLVSGIDPEKIFHEVEWKTIFFFAGLFVLVGGLKETGVIKALAEQAINFTKGDASVAASTILWVSAIASAFVDNIPFVATMIPLLKDMGSLSGMDLGPLWWSLSLGACLGGNGTVIGASANVIAIGMSEEFGHKISFMSYFKTSFPVMIFTIVVSNIYIIFRYF